MALAQQTHTTLVVEDQPLKSSLDAAKAPKVSVGGEAFSTLLPKIAAAYDYDVLPLENASVAGRVFLLKKRFTDPNDLPDVTLAECNEALKNIADLIAPFNPHFTQGGIEKTPAMRDFLLSLTPAQIQGLGDKEHGLPVASLDLPQQQVVQLLLQFFYVQMPTRDLPSLMQQIKSATESDPQFCQHDINDLYSTKSPRFLSLNLFGFELPQAIVGGKKATPRFTILSQPKGLTQKGGALIVNASTVQDGLFILPEGPDPSDPIQTGEKPVLPVLFGSTLSEILNRLNHKPNNQFSMSVDPILASKRAAVFGEENAPPGQVLQALGQL